MIRRVLSLTLCAALNGFLFMSVTNCFNAFSTEVNDAQDRYAADLTTCERNWGSLELCDEYLHDFFDMELNNAIYDFNCCIGECG